jgi:hypothetical protein
MAAYSAPPVPPSVVAQQQPQQSPVANFVAGAQPLNYDAIQLLKTKMDGLADQLSDVAKISAVEMPQIMPVLKKVAQGLSLIATEVESKMSQGQSPNQAPSQLQQQEPETPSNVISAA